MIDTNCSDKYKALRKNLLDAILITREEWDEYQNLKEKQGRRVYISNLEYTKTHDGVGGVSGQFVFKDPIPYEEYEKMVSETYFWLSDGIYNGEGE